MTPSITNNTGKVAVPLIVFVLTILPAISLLIAALTIWLSRVLGSAILSCVVVGGAFLLVATIIYLVTLRGAVKRMQERLETIYETSRVFKTGFDKIRELVDNFRS